MKSVFESITLSLLVFSFTSCATIRLGYEGKMTNSKGQSEVVKVEKSYPIEGAIKPLCIITAIGLGGSCWFYLAMPTTTQRALFRADALRLAKKSLNNEAIELQDEKISRVNWQDQGSTVTTEVVRE